MALGKPDVTKGPPNGVPEKGENFPLFLRKLDPLDPLFQNGTTGPEGAFLGLKVDPGGWIHLDPLDPVLGFPPNGPSSLGVPPCGSLTLFWDFGRILPLSHCHGGGSGQSFCFDMIEL